MRLLIDGVIFQIENAGIARVWRSILPYLAQRDGMEVSLLDRGGAPNIEGLERIPFPSYQTDKYTAADSLLIQRICEHFQIDVFTSTYYTTPLSVPMVLMVYDPIPGLSPGSSPGLSKAPTNRAQAEKEVAVSYAQRFFCISQSTRRDLLAQYPEIGPNRASVGRCGVELPRALDRVREPAERLDSAGLAHARRLRWRPLADAFALAVEELHAEAAGGCHEAFFQRWRGLRELQAGVDVAVPNPLRRTLRALIAVRASVPR